MCVHMQHSTCMYFSGICGLVVTVISYPEMWRDVRRPRSKSWSLSIFSRILSSTLSWEPEYPRWNNNNNIIQCAIASRVVVAQSLNFVASIFSHRLTKYFMLYSLKIWPYVCPPIIILRIKYPHSRDRQ